MRTPHVTFAFILFVLAVAPACSSDADGTSDSSLMTDVGADYDTGSGDSGEAPDASSDDVFPSNPDGSTDADAGDDGEEDDDAGDGCQPGANLCSGECVRLHISNDHCGECGNSCAGGEVCQEGQCSALPQISEVVEFTNEARATSTDCGEHGVFPAAPPVEANPELHKAAQMHADRMANYDFFAHDDPYDGSDFAERINRTDYQGSPAAENIAAGQMSAQTVVQGWVDSDGHCKNLMKADATEIGVGYREATLADFSTYWVQVFGR